MDTILILDFGGQTTQLIGRRIREFGVYSRIVNGTCAIDEVLTDDVKGIVLSGSPYSCMDDGSPAPDPKILDCAVPVLGICYGFHQLVALTGGQIRSENRREYGRIPVSHSTDALFKDIPENFDSWMSHQDSVRHLGEGFELIASSSSGLYAAARHKNKALWGVQFHPEASHCQYGNNLLENFSTGICMAKKQWSLQTYIDNQCDQIQKKALGSDVLLLISGGVDSTVAAALLLKALPKEKVWLMYIDTGMMREGESQEITGNLKLLGARNLLCIDARNRFLNELKGICDPERKRKIIGDTFMSVQKEEIGRHLGAMDYLLAQGTLYTDLIESGQGVGGHSQVIKSHHNVGTPLVDAKRKDGRLLEPLSQLYKDEVRRLGAMLQVSDSIINRHPFPGPGLGIRIIGDISKEKLDILRSADDIYIRELKSRGLYEKIWQAFCVLMPVRTVGVAGDIRKYGYVLALRAVVSLDGMSADVFEFPTRDLLEISTKITNTVEAIGRVVYDVSSKPPATIEWE